VRGIRGCLQTEIEPTKRIDHDHPKYKWIALSNTTLGTLLATI
jgi:hypothetical protein